MRLPRAAPARFASYDYGLKARVPPGLSYCTIPTDWVGSDHGRAFYLRPPAACDTTAGYVLSAVAEQVPRIELYYGYNVAELDYGGEDGERVARTDSELAQQRCARPRRLAGGTLLGRPAVGCRTERGDWVEVEAFATYYLDRPAARVQDPDAKATVRLWTTRARLAQDWPVFVGFAAGVSQCVARWWDDSTGAAITVGAAPGRPDCPANAFW
ncbi:MAG TPA: hypothetical protein VKK31_03575 [Thermoanaerobaculia bacterium]|nr:hypothetical protein [Thermoanaerobaculia bacterium]